MARSSAPVQVVSTLSGAMPHIEDTLLEANTQTFYEGQLVYSDQGAITAVADDGVEILGIALKAATNVSSGNIKIPVLVLTPDCICRMKVTNGATAADTDSAAMYEKYAIYVASTNISHADIGDTGHDAVVYLGPCDDAAGDATAYGLFRFLDSVLQWSEVGKS